MEQAKLLSMTAVLTFLVWAAADSLVNETATVAITLDVTPAAANSPMLVEVVEPQTRVFELIISGPRRAVETVQAGPLSARMPVSDRPAGEVAIALDKASLRRQIAEQVREFRSLTLVSVQPATVVVRVDRMVEREVDITVSRVALPYEVEPQLKRTSTTLSLRETQLRSAAPGGELAPLDISPEVDRLFREQPPGESKTISVALSAREFGPGATLDPAVVDVTAAVKTQRSEADIVAVPVLLAVSFPNLERTYRPVARDGAPLDIVAPTIHVRGPAEEVGRLVRGDTRAYGIIRLKAADLEEPSAIKLLTPEYYLPSGVELAQPPEPVEFKLVDVSVPAIPN